MAEKKYVGKGKEVGQYGLINISFRYEDVKPNERGYVNLTVGKMRNTDDKGNTHTVWINDFKPVKCEPDNRVKETLSLPIDSVDLPF